MKKNIFLYFLILSCLSNCKKEKAVNQFGEWTITRTIIRTYHDTTKPIETGAQDLDISLYEDYTGLYRGEKCRWFILNENKLYFLDMAEYALPRADDEVIFTILVDKPNHQIWQSNKSNLHSDYSQEEKWELYEK